MGGGVAALGIILPDGGHRHDLLPCQGIDQAGLAHAGGAEEDHRLSRLQIGVESLQTETGMGADHMGVDSGCHPLHLGKIRPVVLHQIRLGQQDHRGGSGLPGKGQIPLQPPGVEVLVQRLHDEHIIKIRRHRLVPGDRTRLPAGKQRPPGQGGQDPAVAVFDGIHHHIISGGGKILVIHIVFFGFQPCMGDAMSAYDLIALLVDRRHPCGDAGQVLGIRQNAIIFQIHVLSSILSYSFILTTKNGRKNTAAKQPSSWGANCGYHISKVTVKLAHQIKGPNPGLIRTHIPLADDNLTNDHTNNLLSGPLLRTLAI